MNTNLDGSPDGFADSLGVPGNRLRHYRLFRNPVRQ